MKDLSDDFDEVGDPTEHVDIGDDGIMLHSCRFYFVHAYAKCTLACNSSVVYFGLCLTFMFSLFLYFCVLAFDDIRAAVVTVMLTLGLVTF